MSQTHLLRSAKGAMTAMFVGLASMAVAGEGDLAAPTGPVVLTVSGKIARTNAGDTAQFDIGMLESLPATEFETETIWTEGSQTFRGVQLKDFLEAIGSEGSVVSAVAINDYAVEIPVSDAVENGPIIAYMNNGDYMSRREKGPLWVVYPYDSDAAYRSEVIYSRSIWQLDRIVVE